MMSVKSEIWVEARKVFAVMALRSVWTATNPAQRTRVSACSVRQLGTPSFSRLPSCTWYTTCSDAPAHTAAKRRDGRAQKSAAAVGTEASILPVGTEAAPLVTRPAATSRHSAADAPRRRTAAISDFRHVHRGRIPPVKSARLRLNDLLPPARSPLGVTMLKSLSDSRLGSATPREAVTKKVRPSEGRIRVVVRKRPLSARELDEGRRDVLQITTAGGVPVVMVHEPKTKVDMTAYVETHAFRFDGTYGEASSNRAVYDGTAAPLINRLFAGETATCFAYGATGAGKTHTVRSKAWALRPPDSPCLPHGPQMLGSETEHGIYILAAISIFDRLAATPPPDADGAPPPLLRVSSYEIYGGKVFDLLNGRRVLPVREDAKKKVNVVGLTETICESIEHFRDLMIAAHDARQTVSGGRAG
eukprot:scaffold584_cov121-Isochrysis_galbana.AAC.1